MKGFTLLETLVAIGVFSLIIVGVFGVLGASGTHYTTNLVSLNLSWQVRQGMSWLSRDIRQAELSTIEYGETIIEGNTVKTSITFNKPDENGITYSLDDSGQLWRNDPSGTVKAKDITALVFDPVDGNFQKITLTAGKTFNVLGNPQTLTFSMTEKVAVRNP